jgi:hypothetical protein
MRGMMGMDSGCSHEIHVDSVFGSLALDRDPGRQKSSPKTEKIRNFHVKKVLYRVAAINPEFLKYFFKITQHS